jgi:hypothetical protein
MVNTLAQMSGVTLRVTRATLGHLAAVRATYADGRVRQSAQGSTVWPEFDDNAIRREIDTHQLFLYYETFGFKLLGTRQIGIDPRLPSHYHGLEFALLERTVDPLP